MAGRAAGGQKTANHRLREVLREKLRWGWGAQWREEDWEMGWVLGCARATQGPSGVVVTDGTHANAPGLPEEVTHWLDGEEEAGGTFGALGVCVGGQWGE